MKKQSAKNGKKRNFETRFKPGNPGRPKGVRNRFTSLKDSFIAAFEATGGTDGLVAWIKASPRNRGAFYSLVARMLPADLNITNDKPRHRVIVIGKYEDPENPKVQVGQAELDAWGADAPAHLKPLQSKAGK